MRSYLNNASPLSLQTLERVLREIIFTKGEYIISPKSQLLQLLPHIIDKNSEDFKELFSILIIDYQAHTKIHSHLEDISINEIQKQIKSLQLKIESTPQLLKEELFG